MDLSAWRYLVELRRELLSAVGGIANASSLLWWDNTTPNSTTRRRLQKILQDAVREASAFGVYVATRHTECQHPSHGKASDKHGYVWSDIYGLDVEWEDKRFVWDGGQLFQGWRFDVCPCSRKNEQVRHYVIDDLIFAVDSDLHVSRLVGDILSDIQSAIEEAGDRKPRSGIREYLLRAILRINDAIMPMSVDDHVKSILEARKT